MTRVPVACLGLAALLLGASSPAAAAVTRAIKLDNFGYRPADAKIAIFTSDPGATVQVRTTGGATVFTIPTDGGSITSRGLDGASGDQVWWVDFSPFTAAGSYHLHSPSLGAESYTFVVGPAVYNEGVRAALKSFYYQRCNTPKTAAHAGSWADGAACHTADATTGPQAGHVDRGIKDLRGGWHDAGDYNKYVWSATGNAVLFLLKAYEDNPGLFLDADLNIPESGNGVPDILDEVKWELDWLLRMQLPDGSVLSRTHVPGFDADSPPSGDPNLRYYENPNLESGAIFAGSCAVASRVYLAAGQTAYSATLRNAALSTWSWLLTQGNSAEKAWAAAEIFRMDPGMASAGSYVAGFHPGNWSGVFLNVVAFDAQAAFAYVQTPGGSAAVVNNMRASIGNQVNYIFSSDDLYRNGMPGWSYYWGSNAIRAGYGVFLMTAARLGLTGSHTAAESRQHALEFLHFFHGQNTMSMVYLTNMAGLGGEHSSWQVYHAWFGLSGSASSRAQYIGKPAAVAEPHYPYFTGTDNHGINDNKTSALGPAPGFVVGGPNAAYGGDATPPLGAVYSNRFYRDWNDQAVWTARTWEITENSIGYQGPYVALGAYFMEPAAAPTLSVNDVVITEGNTGSQTAVFTVSLSQAGAQTVTVSFATSNGTAAAPSDYTTQSGSRTFNPGTVTQTLSVPVVGDLVFEPNETFNVTLSGASGATISDATGVGTITNDDPVPSISIDDVTIAEGSSGTTNAVFTLTLSAASSQAVTVNFATANGTAVAPGDYTSLSGSRTLSPGALTQTIDVPVVGDLSVEDDETFFVSLGGAIGATISDALGVGTITDDDLPTLSVNDATVTEGNTGSQNAVFTVSLSQAMAQTVTVSYGVTAGTATAGEDFGTVGGTLIFPAGTTSLPAEVPVFGDWIAESSETFSLNLSSPTGATVADGTGAGTITDNDTPGLTISDTVVRESVGTTGTVTFTVTLTPASGAPVTVNYATADGTATVVNDYLQATGPLAFAPGETTRPVTVTVNPDALVEGMETFTVNLSGAVGAAVAHGTGTGQILDPPLGGDFNADDNNDLVWRHDISGQNVIWHMNGTTFLNGTFTTPAALADAGWKIVGTNDFNADGRPDLLWRHATSGQNVLWYMNGAVMTSGTFLTPAALTDVNWNMSGTGDFNLDGKPDILWRHAVSGQNVVWYMGGADGSVLQSGEFMTPSAFTDLNWQMVGTGDFNLEGHTDILWRHPVSGQNVVWYMKGSKLLSGAFTNPAALVDVNWRMVATGDYNSDGKVDIVWRHSVSGQNVIWFMDGINLTGGGFTNTLSDTNWKIVGPR